MTLKKDLEELQERRTDELEIKVIELERKMDLMKKALDLCSKWMEIMNEQSDGDQKIFERLDERITDLENEAWKNRKRI